jgi:hypothetical protein
MYFDKSLTDNTYPMIWRSGQQGSTQEPSSSEMY